MSEQSGSASQAVAAPKATGLAGAYRWYVLALLTMAYAAHAMDRGMPGILVEPVRKEFHLRDTQLALFTGSGFGIAFALAVLPMGWLSDRTNRRNFLGAILVLWSALTALGGVTRSFAQLALTRVGVGAAEAGAAPVILPMVSDLFPAQRRALATGILFTGVPLGGILAAVAGGYVAATYGWRAALLLAGLPGLAVAALLFLTVRDPPHEGQAAGERAPPPSLAEVAAFLARQPGLICVMLGSAMIGLIAIGLGSWTSSFFVRVWGMDLKQVGLILGLGGGAAGMLSPLVYGAVTDRFGRGANRPLLVLSLGLLLSAGAGLTWLFAPSLPMAIGGMLAAEMLRNGYPAVTYPVLMTHTPPPMRGIVMSVVQLITNLSGFVLGPLVVGVISDHYGGGKAIRYGMANVIALYAPTVLLLLMGMWLLHRRDAAAAR